MNIRLCQSQKILHLFEWDKKFAPQFIKFVNANFQVEEHRFIIYGVIKDNVSPEQFEGSYIPCLIKRIFYVIAEVRRAKKVIVHGLFNWHLMLLLALQPSHLKKCYWVIWGGDLYEHKINNKNWRWLKDEFLRRFLISRIGHLVTHIKGDYELAQKWYRAKGEWHECFMYPSNLYQKSLNERLPHEGVNILVGNSADPSNNHIEVLDVLKSFARQNIRIYCPLSYGNQSYAQMVVEYGKMLFGSKFIDLREFIPFEKYTEMLAQIDIGIFNHARQQGMGNTTALIGMGKKVYLREEVTSRSMFEALGVVVYSLNEFNLSSISKNVAENNQRAVREYFSTSRLKAQWKSIYE